MSGPTIGTSACFPVTTATLAPDTFDVPAGVDIKPADGPLGALGMFEVSSDGQSRLMSREEIRNTNFQQCPAAPVSSTEQMEAELAGKAQIGTVGPFIVAVPRGTTTPRAFTGNSVVVVGSTDALSKDGATAMASRTGHGIAGLGKDSLVGATEATLVAHGRASPARVTINGSNVTPQVLARQLFDAGWRGGTLRMAVCEAGGCSTSIAQQVANELAQLGAETTVIAPQGNGRVSILTHEDGLPQVRNPPERAPKAAGKGWQYVTAETPVMRVPPALVRGATVAGRATNALGIVTTIKLAWDFQKILDFRDSMRSGQFFKDFWAEVGALPDGSRVKMSGEIGIVDKRDGISIHFRDSKNEWTIRMTSDGQGDLAMQISGTDNGRYVEYLVSRNGAGELM